MFCISGIFEVSLVIATTQIICSALQNVTYSSKFMFMSIGRQCKGGEERNKKGRQSG